jgi:SAM-dependent methyltransferase
MTPSPHLPILVTPAGEDHTVDAWEKNAQIDPLFAILTDEAKRSSWSVDDFFASGETEIGRVFAFMGNAGIAPNVAGRFLDLGCGVGRNTRALMRRFDSGIGIDISPTMISLARHYTENDPVKAAYAVNGGDDLSAVRSGSIDFLYSHIVLQHLRHRRQRRYIAEFMRVLAPDGIAAFQIPTGWISRKPYVILKTLAPYWLKNLYDAVRGQSAAIKIEMHSLPRAIVEAICIDGGGTVLSSSYTNSTERDCDGKVEFMNRKDAIDRALSDAVKSQYLSEYFFVRKRSGPL